MILLPCCIQAQLLKVLPVASARRMVLKEVSTLVAPTRRSSVAQRRAHLFVDVSVFSKQDAGTGIQRVVREVMSHLFKHPAGSFIVVPIAADKHRQFRTVAYGLGAADDVRSVVGKAVVPVKGDVFLGLDLAAHLLPHHFSELLRWKRTGVSIQMVVYDLLPALRPDWFNPKAAKNFGEWLKVLAIFVDRFHCISNTVKSELVRWFQTQYAVALDDQIVSVFPLGSNLSAVKVGSPAVALRQPAHHDALAFAQRHPTALMVGTIEPRKGHADVISAFLELWRQGSSLQLILVGTPGWKTEALQQVLADAAATTRRLLWLQDADDSLLVQLYQTATGVLVASKGEGFGLPLIEAAFYGKPVLARDIPVFREVARGDVTFFPDLPNGGLTAHTLAAWFESCAKPRLVPPDFPSNQLPDWATTTKVLLDNTGLTSDLFN